MIRSGRPDDWQEVYNKVHTFNDQYFKIALDTEKLRKWFQRHLDEGIILLSPTGLITGLFIEDPVRNWNVLAETAWYDIGHHGSRLLTYFINYGEEVGADEVRMTTLNTSPEEAIQLLQRKGFEEIERSHRLIL